MSIATPEPQRDKHCFTYCGDDACDCGAKLHPLFAEIFAAHGLTLRDSDGSPKGGDACGSVHDSAVAKPIAQGQSV